MYVCRLIHLKIKKEKNDLRTKEFIVLGKPIFKIINEANITEKELRFLVKRFLNRREAIS